LSSFNLFKQLLKGYSHARTQKRKKERKKEKKVPQFPALLPRKGDAFVCTGEKKERKKKKKERKKFNLSDVNIVLKGKP